MAHSKKITAHGGVVDGKSIYYVEIIADTAADIPDPAEHPDWEIGSTMLVLDGGGTKYILSNARTWVEVPNFTGAGSSSPASVEQNVEWVEGLTTFGSLDSNYNATLKETIKAVVVPDGTTDVCASIFQGYPSLQRVVLPDTVKKIGNYAFANCTALNFIDLGSGVETLGYMCLSNTAITELTIPASVTSTDMGWCADNAKLERVYIKASGISMNSASFSNCTNLTDIYVPWAEGEVANAPWGATNATIHYNT